MHFVRGAIGAVGNVCFFWTLTHMLLADAMALQFSRPLFMIPLALLFLGEVAGWRRTIGGAGRASSASCSMRGRSRRASIRAPSWAPPARCSAALVVICIKRLATTEPTRVIMFYYAFWNAVFALIPAICLWVTPTWLELALLVVDRLPRHLRPGPDHPRLTLGDATVLVPLDYSRIVYSAVLGYLVFGEVPGPWSFAGMALIVACSLYLVLTEKRRQRLQEPAAIP